MVVLQGTVVGRTVSAPVAPVVPVVSAALAPVVALQQPAADVEMTKLTSGYPPLMEMSRKFECEFGLSGTLQQVVDAAAALVGVDVAGKSLGQKAQATWDSVYGKPACSLIPAPSSAVQSVPSARFKLALRDGRGIALEPNTVDATHGRRAFMMRMAAAADAIEVEYTTTNSVRVVGGHHTLGFHLDNWYGKHASGNRQHFSTWEKTNASHQWEVDAQAGTISPLRAPHLVLGWRGHCCLVPRGDGAQMTFAALPFLPKGPSDAIAGRFAFFLSNVLGCFSFLW